MSTDPIGAQGEALGARQLRQRLLLADRYRLETVIGCGGMGQVWQGWDELLERAVAVKVLHEIRRNEVTTGRFALEARTAAQLNSPHVVAVYDFGTDQDRPYLVMELVTGRSLAQELETAVALDASRAALLSAQVAAGLAGAHRHGVVHRDIKPSNLLVDSSGRVSIADFGIARFTQDTTAALGLTANGHVMGTVAYLAPERAVGRPATPASDVYALGCVLYQLLTGIVPFRADLPAATLYQHVHTEPDPPHRHDPAIPAALSRYVLRLLAKDPAERPTAEEAVNWLRRWAADPASASLNGAPHTPRRPPQTSVPAPVPLSAPTPDSGAPSQTARPRSKKRRARVTGAAVVTVGAAAAGILALSGPISGTDKPQARSQPSVTSSHPASGPVHTGPTAPPASTMKPRRPSPAQPHTSPSAGSAASTPRVTGAVVNAKRAAPPGHDHGRKGRKPNAEKPGK